MPMLWMQPSRPLKTPCVVVFRSSFTMTAANRFTLRFSADEHADLFLNGERLCAGPQRGTTTRWFLETHSSTLSPGTYTLTARLLMFGKQWTAFAQHSLAMGFYAESEQLTAPWEWQEMTGVTWEKPFPDWAMYPRPLLSTAANHDILAGKGGRWEPVDYREDQRHLIPRTLPALRYELEKAYRVEQRDNGQLFIFDRYACVWGDYRFAGKGSVTMRWAECLYTLGTFDKQDLSGDKGNRADRAGKEWIGNGTRIDLDGGSCRWHDFWWKAGRYLLMEFTGTATLLKATFHATGYPWQRQWQFMTSSTELNKVLEMAWQTILCCSHENFVDCPYFEQLHYVSDARLQSLSTLVTTRDTTLIHESLRTFAASQQPSGMIHSRTPSKMPQVIPSFALIYILMLNDLADWRSPDDCQPYLTCARNIMRFFANHANGDLLHFPGWTHIDTPEWRDGDPAWNFVDWVDGWPLGVPPGDCAINIFYLLAMESMTRIDPERADDYEAQAHTLSTAIRRHFEVPGIGFADDEAHRAFSEHAQVLATLSSHLPNYAPDIANAAETSVSFSYYYLEAARKLSRHDLFAKRLTKWLALPADGLATLPENFGRSRSDCHGWSSHIIHHCFASVLGLRPQTGRRGHWRIDPLPIGLTNMEGSLPLGDGLFCFHLEHLNDTHSQLHYVIPPGQHLQFQGNDLAEPTGSIDVVVNKTTPMLNAAGTAARPGVQCVIPHGPENPHGPIHGTMP